MSETVETACAEMHPWHDGPGWYVRLRKSHRAFWSWIPDFIDFIIRGAGA